VTKSKRQTDWTFSPGTSYEAVSESLGAAGRMASRGVLSLAFGTGDRPREGALSEAVSSESPSLALSPRSDLEVSLVNVLGAGPRTEVSTDPEGQTDVQQHFLDTALSLSQD